jgi:hypothetical protein
MAAGCFNEEDLKCLCGRNVGFVTRFIPNGKAYKRILEDEIHDVDDLNYHEGKTAVV